MFAPIGPGPVTNLRLTIINDSAITISWEEVSLSQRNGNITSYYLNVTYYNGTFISEQNTSSLMITVTGFGKTLISNNSTYTLCFIETLRPYIVNIRANNGAPEDGINTQRIFFTREGSKSNLIELTHD